MMTDTTEKSDKMPHNGHFFRYARPTRSMTLSVPDCPETRRRKRLRIANIKLHQASPCLLRKLSWDGSIGNKNGILSGIDSPLDLEAHNGVREGGGGGTRKLSLADALSGSIRTLTMITGVRRHSSPLRRRKMKKSRLVLKNGLCNVYNSNVERKDRQYMRDIFTTMIDVEWRWMLLIFALVFLTSWTTFAVAYYGISYSHGDLDLYSTVNRRNRSNVWEPCIAEIHSLYSAFLYSIETQHTIGYGTRHVTTACVYSGMVLCLQCFCGLIIQSFVVGLVFAKMARPKKRAETLIFSEKAVISLRNGQLCLLFRVGDMRNTHLVEAHVRIQLITDRETEEGEIEPLHQFEMRVGSGPDDDDRIFLVWPITVCHVIDSKSPLFEYSAKELPTAQFEVVVLLEGIVESTGMTAQARTSYLPSEIVWGNRFKKLVTYQRSNGSYKIDYDLFHSIYSVSTPQCSAKQFYSAKTINVDNECRPFFFKTNSDRNLEEILSLDSSPSPCPSEITNKNGDDDDDDDDDDEKAGKMGTVICPPTIVVQSPSLSNSFDMPAHSSSHSSIPSLKSAIL